VVHQDRVGGGDQAAGGHEGKRGMDVGLAGVDELKQQISKDAVAQVRNEDVGWKGPRSDGQQA